MIDKLFFTDINVRQYALIRIVFGLLLFLSLQEIIPVILYFYDRNWWVEPDLFSFFWSALQPYFPSQIITLKLYCYSLFISSFFIILGLLTRFSIFYSIVGTAFLMGRNFSLFYASDVVILIILLYLLFSSSGKIWSVDRLIFKY